MEEMFKQFFITIIVLLGLMTTLSHAQNIVPLPPDSTQQEAYGILLLPEIIIYPNGSEVKPRKVPRKYRKNTRAYNRTIRNLKIVYPLAKKASQKLNQINAHLEKIPTEEAREKFVKREYKKLMKRYKKPMKKLKISQGRMLLLLIDRETGSTTYMHVKEFKGGFTAFFWQGVAKLFGNDLKATYDPYGKDFYLEQLIQQYERGEL